MTGLYTDLPIGPCTGEINRLDMCVEAYMEAILDAGSTPAGSTLGE